ncbi:alpha/beta fold hydrolase [Bradyrhizobium sp. HKCCYLR20261]|uniref:alpha/beta fold hydrolase n=1 Tax=Bradyrhizobium sp. HKCCYLR20261 TaxID=3420760 RepID=UPI003EC01F67
MKHVRPTGPLAALSRRRFAFGLPLLAAGAAVSQSTATARAAPAGTAPVVTHHRTATIDGINIFYREAGPKDASKDAPVVLLLHGFPTSSHMFRNLIPQLADRYRVIAPDYPGYGQSDMPDRTKFTYSFDRFGELIDGLLGQLGVTKFAMYVMDYGAPVGWRLALAHPERVTALIVQNGNAYDEGLKEFWDPIKAYWADHSEARRKPLYKLVTLEITKFQYTDGVSDLSRVSPDNWVHDQALLDRPGNADIQIDMLYDYRTNLPLYPKVQAYFRKHQPPTLIVWGKNDKIFPADGAHPYKRDLPQLEFHLIDTGHFALEDKADEMVPLIRDFLGRKLGA